MINKIVEKIRIRLVSSLDALYLVWLDLVLKPSPEADRLLIVKIDAIGDYMLHRGFFESTREVFPKHKIVYCGQQLVKHIAETFDSNLIDEFIWIDRSKLALDLPYRWAVMRRFRRAGFGTVINPTFTRDFRIDDLIVRSAKAPVAIGFDGEMYSGKMNAAQKSIADRYYTRLVHVTDENWFEFDRLRAFFTEALNHKVQLERPHIQPVVSMPPGMPDQYVVFFPGASAEFRQWPAERFAEIGEFIHEQTGLAILITGGPGDQVLAKRIMQAGRKAHYTDLTGKTKLSELISLLHKSTLLLSNETGAVHMAAALSVPTVVISNGNHFGRFNPYPARLHPDCTTIYPPRIEVRLENDRLGLIRDYGQGSRINISEVPVIAVMKAVEHVLEKAEG